jgi:hypothetical protein
MINTVAVLLVLVLAGHTPADTSGTIKGTVRSAESGELLPLAKITILPSKSEVPLKFITTRTGEFTMVGIPAGSYSIMVSHEGCAPITVKQVQVRASSDTTLTFSLRSKERDAVQTEKPGVEYKMRYYKPKTHESD